MCNASDGLSALVFQMKSLWSEYFCCSPFYVEEFIAAFDGEHIEETVGVKWVAQCLYTVIKVGGAVCVCDNLCECRMTQPCRAPVLVIRPGQSAVCWRGSCETDVSERRGH